MEAGATGGVAWRGHPQLEATCEPGFEQVVERDPDVVLFKARVADNAGPVRNMPPKDAARMRTARDDRVKFVEAD